MRNERVERRLDNILAMTTEIITLCNNIISDAHEVENCMDLGAIESEFSTIERIANDGMVYTQETWDYFEEE